MGIPENRAEDYIVTPVDKKELLVKVKSLIKRNDIYKNYGSKINIEKSVSKEANKILLIDDDAKLLRLFEYNLKKAGFEVTTVKSGIEALEKTKSYIPDIILCDIMMPEMDGFELRKLILQNPGLKSIPFVFLTAKGEEQDILEGYDLEIEDYILKTAGPRIVIAKVSAILKSLDKERKKLVSEIHEAADSLRAKVVPDNFPVFNGFKIQHWHQPYKGIPGGDFIDYFKLDEDNFAIILGDVMGKKWGAWYFAFAYAGYIRSAIRVVLQSAGQFTPAVLLQKINESIYQDAKVSEVFATISIVVINNKTMTAKYAGAGDFPALYKNSESGEILQLHSDGLLLGFSAEGGYSDIKIDLKNNDMLFLLTDGITESRNEPGEMYGAERIKMCISKLSHGDNVIEKVKSELMEYTSGNFDDDLSVIVIEPESTI